MDNQPQNEQMVQERQQQEQQQFLQPWQWRFPPPRLLELPPHQKQRIQSLWRNELQEVIQMTDFRNHQLPLARIKKVMKSDEEVKMIASDAPVLLAKACEMLIHDLSLRAWLNVEDNNRRTIQRSDISDAIWRTDIYDFLIDIVPRESINETNDGLARMDLPVAATAANVINGNYIGIPAAATAANIVTGSHVGVLATAANIVGGNYVGAPHYYPFMGPAGQDFMQGPIGSAATGNNSAIFADDRVGATGDSSRAGSNSSDMPGLGLYYLPVGMMDPRFAVGQGWPSGFHVDAPSSGPLTQRHDVDKEN